MSITPIGPSVIDLAGAQGPSAAAARIATNVADSSAGSGTAQALELAVLEKALEATQREAIDLHV
jgi:hypothetical protein